MNRISLIFAALVSIAFAGCATVGTEQPAEKQEGSVLTGSRLPHGSTSVRMIDQRSYDNMIRNQGHIPGPGGG